MIERERKYRLDDNAARRLRARLELLAKMGFRANTRYVKDTAIFHYRSVLVSVDRISGIGWFCEIESDDLERISTRSLFRSI